MKIALLVLNYNDANTTSAYINKVGQYDIFNRIIIVDNYSSDNSFQILSRFNNEKIQVICSKKNGGYGYGNNFGIRYIAQNHPEITHILISNPDVDYSETTVQSLVNAFKDKKDVAITAPISIDINGCFEKNTAWKIPTIFQCILSAEMIIGYSGLCTYKYPFLFNNGSIYKKVECVAGSLLLVDVNKMLKYGMYDENMFLFWEETCLSIKFKKAHLSTILVLNAVFIHRHSVSISKTFTKAIQIRKLNLSSRLYLLKHYLHATNLQLFLARFIFLLSVIEAYIVEWFRYIFYFIQRIYHKLRFGS